MSISGVSSSPTNETFGKDVSIKLEQPVGAMSISPSGRDVVLASKEGLHVIDLDSPYSPPRYLPHRTPWEVADVQWSPFASRDYWIVSTSNQKALVWNLGTHGWQNSIEYVLHGHSRAITDINFSAFHPDILATCAVDSFVHCWDLRIPLKPAYSFSDWFAGATQVKWSRQDEHVVASSHDKVLHIWDDRNGAYPARTIQAHDTKIYGIDWNRFEPRKIVTCSLDKTIKFWDTNKDDDEPERVIQTSFPIWRARHTPFGWGLMAMPQRGDGDLHLYDRRPVNGVLENGPVRPAHKFEGHKGQVKEFLWRATGSVQDGVDHRDFQLVSWGTDKELKLHAVAENTFLDVGYEKGFSKPQRLNFTRKGARYRTFRDETREPTSPLEHQYRTDSLPSAHQYFQFRSRPSTNVGMSKIPVSQLRGWLQAGKRERRTGMQGKGNFRQDMDPISWMKNVKIASWNTDALADELTQVGEKFKRVDFESVDVSQRKATMSLQGPWGENSSSIYTRIDLRFPKTYPRHGPPTIYLQNSSSMSDETYRKLSSEIQSITEAFAAKSRGCLEAIIRYLLHEQNADQIVNWISGESLTESKILEVDVVDDASSDSDDDQLARPGNVSNSSANIRVPLAKGCAALWSENGKLVCFFVPKENAPTSFVSTLGTSRLDEPESGKLFGGFGKIHSDSPRRGKPGPKDDTEDSGSDSSSSGTLSSSIASSSSSSNGLNLNRAFDPYRGTALTTEHQTRSVEGSNKSTTLDGTKPGDISRMNIVSIFHDVDDLLPAKKHLAEQYQIIGDSVDVCKNNARIAEEASLPDVASVWVLLSLILEGTVPLVIQKMSKRKSQDILALARKSQASIHRSSRGTSPDHMKDKYRTLGLQGRMRWGCSAAGPGYLLPAIFSYYEKISDVQMLAMLSCILLQAESEVSISSPSGVRQYMSTQNSTNLYFASPEVARSLTNQSSPKKRMSSGLQVSNTSNAQETSLRYRRRSLGNLSIGPHGLSANSSESHNYAHAPSVVAEDPSGVIIAPTHSNISSMSPSPERDRLSRYSETSTAFPASKASLVALTKSYSNSPPSQGTSLTTTGLSRGSRSQRAIKDGETHQGDSRFKLRSSVTMMHLPSMKTDGTKTPDTSRSSVRSILKSNGQKVKPTEKQKRKPKMKTKVYNQDMFDVENQSSVPLIPSSLRQKFSLYLGQYVHLLEVWQLWLERAEIMKIMSEPTPKPDLRARSRAQSITKVPQVSKGLEIRRCCPTCGDGLAPIEKNGVAIGWHCIRQSCLLSSVKLSRRQCCSVCEVKIRGLSVPCLDCGHMTCYECAQSWFSIPNDHHRTSSTSSILSSSRQARTPKTSFDDHTSCPTGCGCACPTLTMIDVPHPPSMIELEPSSFAPLSRTESLLSNHSSKASTEINRASMPGATRSQRLMSSNGPDKAISALLSIGHRSRSISTTKNSISAASTKPSSGNEQSQHAQGEPTSANDELVPWAHFHTGTTLGRGISGGLSRGLSAKGSDSTIRKA